MATSILYDFEITGIHLVLLFDVAGFIHFIHVWLFLPLTISKILFQTCIKIYSDIHEYLFHIAQPYCQVLRGEINNLLHSCSCLHKYFQI